MRLNSIKLSGFKSFVDPTQLVFQSNLTAIVGPNGCGKSNIVDAVHCVLGGSSAKSLRAEMMADVIFNGTATRKPVAQAALELSFDNREGGLTGEYAKYPEISIRRELSRDGQSQYYLNGTRCRKKDITDIFLGTGLGPNNYAIIEQGMISRLIEAKPDELRIYVEEPAGISKYKERRRETENRIKHTRENLDRLSDIREEQSKQLSHLQRQANAAERFKVLQEDLRLVKVQHLAILCRHLNNEIIVIETEIKQEEIRFEAQNAELRQVDKEIESHRLQRIEYNDAFNETQSQYYSVGADISRIEQKIHHAKDRERQLENDLHQLEQNYQEVQQQLTEDQLQIDEIKSELALSEGQIENKLTQARETQNQLARAESRMLNWQEQWDEYNRDATQTTKQIEVEQTKLFHLEQKQHALRQQLKRIFEEREKQDSTALSEEISLLTHQSDDHKTQIENIQEKIATINEQIISQRKLNQELHQQLNLSNNQLRDLTGHQTSLQALQQVALGKNDQAINKWLTQNSLLDKPRLAEGMNVDAGWEFAIETVLGMHLEAVCVSDLEALISSAASIQDASLSLFNISEKATTVTRSNQAVLLSDKIQSNLPIKNLLAHIYAVDTLDEAIQMLSSLEPHESIITREGVWLNKSWLRVGKAIDEKSGILQREHDLKIISAKLEEQKNLVNQQTVSYQTAQEKLHHLEQHRESLQLELQEMNAKHKDIYADLSAKTARLEQFRQQVVIFDRDIKENEQQSREAEQQLLEVYTTVEKLNRITEENKTKHDHLVATRDVCRNELESARHYASDAKQKADECQVKIESMRTQIYYLQQNITRGERQIDILQEKRNGITEAMASINVPLPEWNLELQQGLDKRLVIENELSNARHQLEEIDNKIRELEKKRGDIDKQIQQHRNELEQIRLKLQTLKVKHSTHLEQIEQAGYALEPLLQDLPLDVQATEWEEKIARLETKITRLGPINLAAIEEYAQLLERKQYLDKQNDDLMEALALLETAIHKIDKETRSRFKETFNQLNNTFKEFFVQIFNGGNASLELTGEDFLEAGVLVKAQPPGKRNSTIHQLSGGEKALTAIALVFSIFNLNPAPFCILDEVDAPLDDANVTRFCHLVKKMSEKIQFIFISHNKLTIEMGQQLAGVTMHEPGVSRLVSVDIDEAIAMAT